MKTPFMVVAADVEPEKVTEAYRNLQEAGFDPLMPITSTDDDWREFMGASLVRLTEGDGIATLGDVQAETTGAILVRICRDIGMPVANVDTWIGLKGEF